MLQMPRLPALATMLACVLTIPAAQAHDYVTIAAGETAGTTHLTGGAVCAALQRHADNGAPRCRVSASEGSVANLRSLHAGERELALIRADLADHAMNSSGYFSGEPPFDSLRALFVTHRESLVVVAGPETDIRHPRDLPGHQLAHGTRGSGQQVDLERLMNAQGWSGDDFPRLMALGAADRADALCSGDVDAAIFITGHPDPAVRQALDCGGRLIAMEGAAIDRMVRGHPHYTRAWIAPDHYAGVTEDVRVYAVTFLLMTTTDMYPESALRTVEALLAEQPAMADWHPALADMNEAQRIQALHQADLPWPGTIDALVQRTGSD